MLLLVLGLVLFLGVHSVRVVADGWRTATIARIGALPWKGVYAVLSILGFVLLAWGYGQARQQPVVLWNPPAAMRHATALLMLPVFMLFVAAYVPRNGFKARLGHPQVLSVKLWALAHLLSNGMLADVVLFGAFLVWAVVDFRAARRRPSPQPSPQGGEGGTATGTVICVVAGLVIYVVFALWLHGPLIGVRPFG
ncbi:MAG: NnrU family protein [Pseudomonadota bacterium]